MLTKFFIVLADERNARLSDLWRRSRHWERYPNQVCKRCANKVSDAYGRRLQFFNESLSGDFKAFYRDNGAEYHQQICYIDGRKCFASKNRFGGIVVEVVN